MRWSLLLALALAMGCLKRAPTSYELDRRAGHAIPAPDRLRSPRRASAPAVPLQSTSTLAPSPQMPARIAPVVRRVWVADQRLEDGSWLQGTWLFVEVSAGKWLYEVDPGGGTFVAPSAGAQP